jgi:hypothetical protein
MKNKICSQISFYLSVIAAIIAIIDSLGVGVWLSATSWLVIAAVLGVWAIYLWPNERMG